MSKPKSRMFDIPPPGEYGDVKIHPTAIVEKGAQFGLGVEIGPYAVIGSMVKLGDGVKVGSHCVIENKTTIEERTVVYPFCSIGSPPQDLKFEGEDTAVHIGPENSLRQYVNVSVGTNGGSGVTKVGARNLFMVYSHIGHDSIVGNDCVLANGVSLAGHVTVGNGAILGGHAAVHQFCNVGTLALAAGGAMITQDVPPYCLVHGDRARVNGLNIIGLKRNDVDQAGIQAIKTMFKLLFKENLTLEDCIQKIREEIPESAYRSTFVDFLLASERGVCR